MFVTVPSTGLRHPSFKERAGKRCSKCEKYHLESDVKLMYACFAKRDAVNRPVNATQQWSAAPALHCLNNGSDRLAPCKEVRLVQPQRHFVCVTSRLLFSGPGGRLDIYISVHTILPRHSEVLEKTLQHS